MASAVVLSMVLVGCGSGKDSKKPEIALVTDSGGINDKSFNQSAWEAVKEYGTKNDKGYKYYKPASFDTAGYKDQIKNAVDATIKLGGKGYVFWGGREGYETLLNTNMVQKSLFYQDSNSLLH